MVLHDGYIEQVGSPLDLYRSPANVFVAGFIGSPKMNLVEGAPAAKHGAATIGIRPEHIELSTESGEWPGVVSVAEHLGSDTFLHVQVDGIGLMTARVSGELGVRHGDRVWLTPPPDRLHRFGPDGNAI